MIPKSEASRLREKELRLTYCRGVEGNSIYLNDFRIAGPKPWGGGKVIEEWTVYLIRDIFEAIPELKALQKAYRRGILKVKEGLVRGEYQGQKIPYEFLEWLDSLLSPATPKREE